MLEHFRDKVSIFRHKGEYKAIHDLLCLWLFIFLIWGFYRVLFRLPVIIEELMLKPLVFIVPVAMRLKKEKKSWKERLASLGIGWKNLFAAMAFGLSLGVFYLFVGRMGQFFRFGELQDPYGQPIIQPVLTMVLALATALSEELVFMGYLLPRFQKIWKNEWQSTIVTAFLFAVVHVPILIFGYRFSTGLILWQFLLTFILGFGNGVLMLRLKNLAAPVLSHTVWGMAVLLFR